MFWNRSARLVMPREEITPTQTRMNKGHKKDVFCNYLEIWPLRRVALYEKYWKSWQVPPDTSKKISGPLFWRNSLSNMRFFQNKKPTNNGQLTVEGSGSHRLRAGGDNQLQKWRVIFPLHTGAKKKRHLIQISLWCCSLQGQTTDNRCSTTTKQCHPEWQ